MELKEEESKTTAMNFTIGQKIAKTIFLILCWVALGLSSEITGPTQKDLIIKMDSNYEHIARAVSGRSHGYFVGAIIGGPIVDKLGKYSDLIVALSLDGLALTTLAAPYSPSSTVFWFLCFLWGIGAAILNVAGQYLLFGVWREKSTGPLHILHFGFGVGSFIVPQIANPFLAVLAPSTSNTSVETNLSTTTIHTVTFMNDSSTPIPYIMESRIERAYLIVTLLIALLSVAFLFYQFCFNRHLTFNKSVEKEDDSKARKVIKLVDPGTCANGDRCYGIQIFVLIFFYFINIEGIEVLFGNFIRSYSIDNLNFSGDDGSLINTVYWIGFTVGRFVGLFTGRFITIPILIVFEVSGLFIVTVLVEIFADDNATALWVLTGMVGIFVGPLYPSGVGWGNYHVLYTGLALTFTIMSAAIGATLYLWIIGYLYQHFGPKLFLHQAIFSSSVTLLVVLIMFILSRRHGSRFETTSDKIPTNNEEEMK